MLFVGIPAALTGASALPFNGSGAGLNNGFQGRRRRKLSLRVPLAPYPTMVFPSSEMPVAASVFHPQIYNGLGQ
jgi:hypothetical protein